MPGRRRLPVPDPLGRGRRRRRLEGRVPRMRTQLLEARLEQLQDMVTDLASNERYEDVLQGIVGSSHAAVGAGGALLALEPGPGSPRSLLRGARPKPRPTSIADDLLAGAAPGKRRVSRSSRPAAATASSPSASTAACSPRSPRTPSRPTAGWPRPPSTPPMPWTRPATRPTRRRCCSSCPRRCPRS